MKASLLLVALFFTVALATSEKQYRMDFLTWMHKFSKSYTAGEFQTRYSIFKANHDFVNTWDMAAKGFEVELNQFADLSNAEFVATYMGTKYDATQNKKAASPLQAKAPEANPTSVDWRTKGYVTAIKDQGQCGSCWSFSTTGSTEGAHFKASNQLVSLSEQQLIDCSSSFGNQGCNGGLMDDAFKYIEKNGLVSEASYPYTAAQGTCSLKGKTKVITTLSTYTDITQGSETSLTTAIATVGPISVAIDASHTSFQLYKSGVYYEAACSATQLDHGVLAVGYGTSGSSDYYIVKNSWGTVWGMAGYINMSRNRSNNCGIATMASYPTA